MTQNRPPESPAKALPGAEKQERPATQQDALRALQRKPHEYRAPKKSRESERTETERGTNGQLLLGALDLEPSSTADRLRQKELQKVAKKGDIPPHVVERVQTSNHTINAYLSALMEDPLRESFRPENADTRTRALYASHLKRIDEMIGEAQRKGLVDYLSQNNLAKPLNRVDIASECMGKLQNLSKEIVGNTPEIANMRQYIRKVEQVFEGVLRGDPHWTHYYNRLVKGKPLSPAEEQAKGALRMVALLATAGMAIISGLLDLKNGRLSAYTAAWAGLAAWTAGVGRNTTVTRQLGFVTESQWEKLQQRLGIGGEQGNAIIQRIENKKKETAALFERLKAKGMPKEEWERVRRLYVAKLTGAELKEKEEPKGENATLAKGLLALPPEQLIYFIENLNGVRDATDRGVLSYLVGSGTSGRQVAAEARKLTHPAPQQATK